MELTLVLALALLADKVLGEPTRFHPLVGFGHLVSKLEQRLNNTSSSAAKNKTYGVLAWSLLVVPIVLATYYVSEQFSWWFDLLVLYLAIGGKSLKQHALQVYRPLANNDMAQARHYCSYLVSRDTSELTETQVSRAVVESVLENGHDAVIASMFWYCVGGAPLVIAHRLANTLDAMWGYKTQKFVNFGWFSAKIDDILGWPSAKVTSFLYAIQGPKPLLCLQNAYKQSQDYKSLNGGWVMASGATALFIQLGGQASYFGQQSVAVLLGQGNKVSPSDIPQSVSLVAKASGYFVLFTLAYECLY